MSLEKPETNRKWISIGTPEGGFNAEVFEFDGGISLNVTMPLLPAAEEVLEKLKENLGSHHKKSFSMVGEGTNDKIIGTDFKSEQELLDFLKEKGMVG